MTAVRRAAVVGLGLVVAAGSLVGGGPVNRLADWLPGVDKVLHTTAFFSLFLIGHALSRRWWPGGVAPATLAATLAALAVADELAQWFQAARHADVADLLAGWAGVAIGWGVVGIRSGGTGARALMAAGLVGAGLVTAESYLEQRHLVAALRLERAGDFVGARREYRLALDAGVRTSALFNELAWVEIESGIGDATAAVTFAEQALSLAPDDPDVHDTYGWALHHAGRSAAALPFLERAYRASPDMFCIHYHLGEVYLALGQTDKAVEHLRRQLARPDTREAARADEALGRMGKRP
jgi:tetratricopeptide (TPR) repeat protein